jgi:hypothetical protein
MPSFFEGIFLYEYIKIEIISFVLYLYFNFEAVMKKLFLIYIFLLLIPNGFAQSNLLWQGYFSYKNVKDISESSSRMYGASENALFSKDLATNDLKTTNTIDGLSGETISTIYHSQVFNKTLVGYENGLLIVINDSDGSMYSAIGILQKQIPANIKKINHFMEKDGVVYVSCDFGIVQFFLSNSEFGDTYFLGSSISDYLQVLQTTIYNNAIYAVTKYNGIKKGDLANPNLNDFSQWSQFDSGSWNGIATINNQLVASNTNNFFYKWNGTSFVSFYTFNQSTVDFRVFNNFLIATNPSRIVIINDLLSPITQIDNSSVSNEIPVFTCATVINDKIYIGTLENGLYTTGTTNQSVFENISPDGPLRNALFGINASTSNLWAVYGGYSADYNPYTYNSFGTVNTYGISKFNKNGWKHIPYSSVLGAKALTKITVNPNNTSQVFISSFNSGLLKVENDVPTFLYNQTNTGIDGIDPSGQRINGTAYDKTGNLWMYNCRSVKGVKVFKSTNVWQSVSVTAISSDVGQNDYGNVVIDKNGTKWYATSRDGVLAYNETSNPTFKKLSVGSDLGNLPIRKVRVVAIDNKNQLWIGTSSGLRVLSSVDSFQNDVQPKANSIIILEAGLAQELFYEQNITDIVVDGANRKWVGTSDSGVFLVSSNGQETIYHFTKSNSPLPSNALLDIDINPDSGEVFFATDKGMISFKGTSTKASDNLENVYVYPNPVRPEFSGTVKISGLLDKANIKISDIEGNLVYETTSEGGTIEWDTTAFGNYKVASGVYMIFISAQDGLETKVKKVMIIR